MFLNRFCTQAFVTQEPKFEERNPYCYCVLILSSIFLFCFEFEIKMCAFFEVIYLARTGNNDDVLGVWIRSL